MLTDKMACLHGNRFVYRHVDLHISLHVYKIIYLYATMITCFYANVLALLNENLHTKGGQHI